MRLLAGILTTMAVASLGFAVGVFALGYFPPEPEEFSEPQRAPSVAPKVIVSREVPDWPAVFGTIAIEEPETIEVEPEPVVEAPTEENTTYWLTGLVAGEGQSSWAMISENDRGVVVREGDVLVGGETVVSIDQEGVWIEFDGALQLIPKQRTDFGSMVKVNLESNAAESDNAPTTSAVTSEVTVFVEALDQSYVEGLISAAGGLTNAGNQEGGGLEIAGVVEGQLFDQVGLAPGDRILFINGTAPVGPKTPINWDLVGQPDDGLLLDVIRSGNRETVRVRFDQG